MRATCRLSFARGLLLPSPPAPTPSRPRPEIPTPFSPGNPPQLVAVPTHFYKVVLAEDNGGRRSAVGAFVMPNAPIAAGTPLAGFCVPLTSLEDVAGLAFFPQLMGGDSNPVRGALDSAALRWQSQGRAEARRPALPPPPALLPPPSAAAGAGKAVDGGRTTGALVAGACIAVGLCVCVCGGVGIAAGASP